MKKKGFTLVELLGVIVLLAVIALIATPTVLDVIEDSRKGSFKSSVLGILQSGEFYRTTNALDYNENGDVVFECDGKACTNKDNKTEKLNFKGEIPTSGLVIVKSDGSVEASYLKNKRYCALGEATNLDIQEDCTKLDITEAVLKVTFVKATTSEIIINVEATDIESGIKKIEYTIDGKTYTDSYDQEAKININKTFSNLESNKDYKIKVTVTNGNDKEVSAETTTIKTSNVGGVTVNLTSTPTLAQNGYRKSQTATMTYSGAAKSPYYYVKTTREADATATTMSCGTETKPETCSTISSTTRLAANTWYRYSSIPTVTYDEESDSTATIYVAVGDGTNLTTTATATIDKIDTTSPSITLGTATSTTKNISIPVTMADSKSGLATPTCKYSTTDGSYTSTTGVTVSTTNCTITGIESGKTYYYQICVADKVGNKETCKTGSSKTNEMGTASISLTNTPATAQNGYRKNQVATITYSGTTISNPYYYVKTTRAADATATTMSCGNGTTPGTCSTISSTTRLSANTWYRYSSIPTVTYDEESDSTATIYVAVGDGTNLTTTATATIDKIDTTSPSVTLGTATKTTKSISIPITMADSKSGLGTPTCKYSTTDGSYTSTTGVVVSTTNCTITGIESGKTYYYQICVADKVGNKETCKTGNSATDAIGTASISLTSTPATAQNGYRKSQTATMTYTGSAKSPYYYVKTTREADATATTISCGNGTTPGTCSTISSTTRLSANTWYRYSTAPTVTYDEESDSTATIYVAVGDGTNLTSTTTATIDKIDRTSPSVTLGVATATTKSINIPITMADSKSGLATPTCKYSTTDGSYTSTTGVTVNTTSCTITGIESGKTYYYQVCVADKVGNTQTCKTGNTATNAIGTATVKLTNTPTTAQNGYLKQQTATITYTGSITSPYYYVKTTRAATSTAATSSCGTGTTPGTCSTISSTTNLAANTWYRYSSVPTITYSTAASENATIYVAVGDGTNLTATSTGTVSKIDRTSPSVTLGTATKTTKSISIPITMSDSDSGLGTPTCKYSTTSGSYTSTTGVTVSTTNCTITGIESGKTYYYQVCVADKVGNTQTCKTGNSATNAIGTATVKLTNTPTTAQNGYLKQQTATITYTGSTISSPYYYVKTTRTATGTATTLNCGTGTIPGTCSTISSTTSLSANTWYRYSSVPTITYSTAASENATIYVAVGDGTNLTATSTGTVSKIDRTSPSLTLGSVTPTSKSISIPLTMSDSESGLGTPTCKYSTTDGSYTSTTGVVVGTTNCTITGITANTTYYYQVCVADKVGNTQTCKTGSAKTGTIANPTITFTNTPAMPYDGYLDTQVAKVTYSATNVSSPQYFVKTTRAGVSSLSVTQSCGTGTTPGTCSTITSTTSLAANTWYKVSGNVNVTYSSTATSTATIYAITYDGTNFSSAATGTVSKIDGTAPTNVTINKTSSSTKSVTITASCEDSESGVSKIELSKDGGKTYEAYSMSNSLWQMESYGISDGSQGTMSASNVYENGTKVKKFVMGSSNTGVVGPYFCKTGLTVGTTYKWSIYLKGSASRTIRLGHEQGGITNVTVGTDWKKYTYTFTATDTTHKCFVIYTFPANYNLYVHSLSLMAVGTTTPLASYSYTFDNLTSGSYDFKARCTNNVGNQIESAIAANSTSTMGTAAVKLTNTPTSTQNGYLKQQVATVAYTGSTIASPYYYVKTTRAATGTATTVSCGTGTTPGTCSTITSTTSLAANTWYRYTGSPTITYNTAASTTATLYAAVGDGTNISGTATGTISKIDRTSPSLTLGTVSKTTKSIVIPLTMSDSESGLGTPTCKYSTTNGSYTSTTGVTVNTTSCTITGITAGTTYYYQICVADKVGNTSTCKVGNSATNSMPTAAVKFTNTPTTAVDGYLTKQTATITYTGSTISSPYYYVKTTREATGTATTVSCGTGTTPGTCSTITSTTVLAANTWYRYSSVPTITYSTAASENATIYVAVGDGTNISATATGTVSKIFYNAANVTYTNSNASGVANVEQALDYLYDKLG